MHSLKQAISTTPNKPGIYKYFNKKNILIYVGKAKDLKKRVSSYFNKNISHNRKTRKLISEIISIDFVVTHSEIDAYLLESNLIKVNQPKYNILLKDDKSFPYICISNQRFPRIYSTRTIDKSKGQYFGPYTSVEKMRSVLDFLNKSYTLRTCKYNLSKKNIDQKKYKVCLEYHINNCKAPCQDYQSEEDYTNNLKQAESILKGDISTPLKLLEKKMYVFSTNLEFEKAEEYRVKLKNLTTFYAKSIVINPKVGSFYVITLLSTLNKAYLNFMKVKDGSIIQSNSLLVKKQLEESDSKVLTSSIPQLINNLESRSRILILSNIRVESLPESILVEVPKIGDKKKIVAMSVKNAFFFRKTNEQKVTHIEKTNRTLILLQKALHLKSLPHHIECFDNSNIQGTHPVASMVCFKDGKPSKKDYRKYTIKTVVGANDFASMYEVIYRRYSRVKKENSPLPDLILIDGGRGQLNAAIEALKSIDMHDRIAIAGIAKRLEEIYLPYEDFPIHINKLSSSLKLLQQLRNEAHRFAVTFHRLKRSKSQLISSLDNIKGIGSKTMQLLTKHYKSPKNIKASSKENLIQVIGEHKADLVFKHYRK